MAELPHLDSRTAYILWSLKVGVRFFHETSLINFERQWRNFAFQQVGLQRRNSGYSYRPQQVRNSGVNLFDVVGEELESGTWSNVIFRNSECYPELSPTPVLPY